MGCVARDRTKTLAEGSLRAVMHFPPWEAVPSPQEETLMLRQKTLMLAKDWHLSDVLVRGGEWMLPVSALDVERAVTSDTSSFLRTLRLLLLAGF